MLDFLAGIDKNPIAGELYLLVAVHSLPYPRPAWLLCLWPSFPHPLRQFPLQSKPYLAVITVIEQALLFSFFIHLRCSKKENKSRQEINSSSPHRTCIFIKRIREMIRLSFSTQAWTEILPLFHGPLQYLMPHIPSLVLMFITLIWTHGSW